MIQDIAPHTYHNEYKPSAPDKNSFILAYEKGSILLPHQEREADIYFPRFQDLEEKVSDLYSKYIYLFSIDDHAFLSDSGIGYHPSSRLRIPGYTKSSDSPGHSIWHLQELQDISFSEWYSKRRFCGCCGKPMLHSQKERMMECPSCGNQEYPVLCPAVIVGITNGDKIILSKYEGRRFKRYALIAGFAEIGETIEETVHREVMEEVGLKVKNLRYYKSQPWSFSGTLLFGFFCDVDGDDTLTVDHEELSMAQWVERDKIPDQGNNISLTKEMMMLFRDGKEPR